MRGFQKGMLESGALDILTKAADKARAPIIHRKKLFNGEAAEDVHSKNAFPKWARCEGCKRRRGLMTRVIILMPLDEARKRDGELDQMFVQAQNLARSGDPSVLMKLRERLVDTKHGQHIRVSTVYACKACTPALEREVAKAPSWVIVDINRGPGPDKAVAGLGGR